MNYKIVKILNKNLVNTMILGFLLLTPIKTLAHGSNIQYRTTQSIEIKATFDNGEAMKNAQVVIYAPDNPSTPWLKGVTNEEGIFVFTPDTSKKGNWDVKVRQAGHGDIVSIALDEQTQVTNFQTINNNNSSETLLQKIIVAGIGVWGCVGTALFFIQKKLFS